MSVIDVSSWQRNPDLAAAQASGINLVICKAVDVERGYPITDSTFLAKQVLARGLGLRFGSYLFNGPYSPTEAADVLLSVIGWRPGDYVAIDVENALGVNRWSPDQVLEFCTELIRRGIPGGLILAYMSTSVGRAYDWTPVKALGVQPWLAQYGTNDGTQQGSPGTGTWGFYGLWQYTSLGPVPGIGLCDVSVMGPSFASAHETPINSTTTPPPPPYFAPPEDDMFRLYYRKDAPTAVSPSGVTYALGVLDPSWQTPGHNFWFEATAESRRDWRELFGFRDADGTPQAQIISADIWNSRSSDPNRISDVSKYLPPVNAPAQVTNVTAGALTDADVQRIANAVLLAEAPTLHDLAAASASSPGSFADAILTALKAKL